MTKTEMAYLDELAADIAVNGGLQDREINECIAQAHARRQSVAEEIAYNTTRRAKMARVMLSAQVWAGVMEQNIIKYVMTEHK